MNHDKMIEILMKDGCTRNEAEKFLNNRASDGSVVFYDSFSDYVDDMKGCGCYEGETLEDIRNGKLEQISAVTYDGKEYILMYSI